MLSPLLYSLYTYDLEQPLTPLCQVLQYADDLVLYINSNSIDDTRNNLNTALRILDEWLNDHDLSLSASKSSCVVFTRKRSLPSIDLFVRTIKCISCFRASPSNRQPIMGELPKFRSQDVHVSHTVGVDIGGQFSSKESTRRNAHIKSYLCVFVCCATRAVHLEVLSYI